MRVVLDLRPLQEPDRGPVTAAYLEELLRAFAADPLPGELFSLVLQAGLPDPSETRAAIGRLDIAGRRWLPPTKLLRSGALTVDPFLLRTASVATGWRAGDRGAAGAVYHAAGGAVPLASGMPLVVSLLDLAPWELPEAYQRTPAARFGQRLRARIVQSAAAVIVPSTAGATATRRLLHVRRARLAVIPTAPREAYRTPGAEAPAAVEERRLRGVPDRYFIYTGRYDARQDIVTLLRALRIAASERQPGMGDDVPWPPNVLVVGTTPDDRTAIARIASAERVGGLLRYAPALPQPTLAALVAGARAVLVPALSDITGQSALDAIAAGTPVVGTTVGVLPEIVGAAGILAEPRDADRLAAALYAAWTNDTVHRHLATAVRRAGRAESRSGAAGPAARTWADVARQTREVYARVDRRP